MAFRSWDGLIDHQRRWLELLRDLGLATDESLAARLAELGEPCDRTTLVGWRSGRTQAPLGLLGAILGHLTPDERCRWLSAALSRWGLRVLPVEVSAQPLFTAVGGLRRQVGVVLTAIEDATTSESPGGDVVTREEAIELVDQIQKLVREAQRAHGAAEACARVAQLRRCP